MMENYEMTMTLDDEVYEKMGRDYIKHLAEAMGRTKEQLVGNLMYETINLKSTPRLVYIKRGRYEIWKFGNRVAKKIKHRREALAMIKLMQATQE